MCQACLRCSCRIDLTGTAKTIDHLHYRCRFCPDNQTRQLIGSRVERTLRMLMSSKFSCLFTRTNHLLIDFLSPQVSSSVCRFQSIVSEWHAKAGPDKWKPKSTGGKWKFFIFAIFSASLAGHRQRLKFIEIHFNKTVFKLCSVYEFVVEFLIKFHTTKRFQFIWLSREIVSHTHKQLWWQSKMNRLLFSCWFGQLIVV